LDARKIEFSLVKNSQERGRFGPILTMDDMGRPQKKAASKNSRPPEKAPQLSTSRSTKKSTAAKGGNKSKAKSNAKRTAVAADGGSNTPSASPKTRGRRK
jgi:ribonuclease R